MSFCVFLSSTGVLGDKVGTYLVLDVILGAKILGGANAVLDFCSTFLRQSSAPDCVGTVEPLVGFQSIVVM